MKPVELKQIAEQAVEHGEKIGEEEWIECGELIPTFDLPDAKFVSTLSPELALKLCALWEAAQLVDWNYRPGILDDALQALEDHK